MTKNGIIMCSLFIVGLFVFGVVQTLQQPHATGTVLAGAATLDSPVPKTQEEINVCMRECMRSCVRMEGMEQQCLDMCNPQCGAP